MVCLLGWVCLLSAPAAGAAQQFIKIGDTLNITASGPKSFSGSYRVISTGEVVVPYVEILYVEGIAVDDLRDLLRKKLSENGVEPEVTVEIAGQNIDPTVSTPPPIALPKASAVPPRDDAGANMIHPGDKLNIAVADEKLLTGEFTVSAQGQISYPLLGNIDVAGSNLDEVREAIRTQLSARYIRNPRIEITFVESQQNSVDISGRVAKPGNYILTPKLTLLRLITQAGGLAGSPGATQIELVRQEIGQKRTMDFRFSELVRGVVPDPDLKSGDIVFVEEIETRTAEGKAIDTPVRSKRVSVFGQVIKPGNYRVNADMKLVELLAEAGGFTGNAASGRVLLVRNMPAGKKTTYIDAAAAIAGTKPDVPIEDGDVLVVQESFF